MNARNDKVLFLLTLSSLLLRGGEGKPKSILPPYALIFAPIPFLFTVLLTTLTNILPKSSPTPHFYLLSYSDLTTGALDFGLIDWKRSKLKIIGILF